MQTVEEEGEGAGCWECATDSGQFVVCYCCHYFGRVLSAVIVSATATRARLMCLRVWKSACLLYQTPERSACPLPLYLHPFPQRLMCTFCPLIRFWFLTNSSHCVCPCKCFAIVCWALCVRRRHTQLLDEDLGLQSSKAWQEIGNGSRKMRGGGSCCPATLCI